MSAATAVSAEERNKALRFIVCLGAVSLFADATYEGAYSILGPYLKELGATATQVGLIAGVGEMLAASLRFFSGRLADRTKAYWAIAISGYALNLLVIPALAFAGSWQAAAMLVVIERTGKALRGPARDVLLTQATGKIGHGWGFGVHAAMDQTGAVAGPLLMVVTVARIHHFAPAFLRLGVPAALAFVAMLAAWIVDPMKGSPPPRKETKELPKVFWPYIAAAGVLACGFADFPLLGYHLQNTGLEAPEMIPLLYAGAMGVTGATALLCGKLFDRYGITVLVAGTIISAFSLPFGFLGGSTAVIFAVCCWAIGLGAQDATLRAGIAQVVSMNKRGAAFGAFNGVFGVMWFLGSALMGFLYDRSLMSLVVFGVAAQLIAAAMFLVLRRPLAAEIAVIRGD
jgi:MFS family permease